MSPEVDVVRVAPATGALGPDDLPRRVPLRLGELVLAARLAGEVPLPVRVDHPAALDRLTERLDGGTVDHARAAITDELARVDDDGSAGARAALIEAGLLVGGRLEPGIDAALRVLAGGALSAVLDVSAVRRAGEVRLRSWFGVATGLAAQLTTQGPVSFELAWFAPRLWVSQLTRAVSVEPWTPEPAPLSVPDFVQLPSELLAGSQKAYRDHRTDLLAPMAATHLGAVRLGEPGQVRAADTEEILALLHTLGGACRGRLRLWAALDRDGGPEASPGVAAWLLFDDGWHELRPGRAATSVLRRRETRDLGLLTRPLVAALDEEVA